MLSDEEQSGRPTLADVKGCVPDQRRWGSPPRQTNYMIAPDLRGLATRRARSPGRCVIRHGEHRQKADGRHVFSTEYRRPTALRILTGEKTLAEPSRELDNYRARRGWKCLRRREGRRRCRPVRTLSPLDLPPTLTGLPLADSADQSG
jgi:hypothetical protein